MGLLIAGNESPLLDALAAEAGRQKNRFATAVIPGPEGKPRAERVNLEWNPSSPISARTLVLEAGNTMDGLNRAILVCDPPACPGLPETLSPAGMDRYLDNNIKGWFFLARELRAFFKLRQGALALVSPAETASPDILGNAAVSAFRALAQSLLRGSNPSETPVTCFTRTDPGGNEAFAAHILKVFYDEGRRAGKWHKFGRLFRL
ncbi:MAG: hypothetical protein LBJ31_11255 [Treponema sp.]|jgi:NAD(P)-dependent dehydrogenase (short-subunit alcohol dehydrogenase family)|nr:hypothetical protein [Treponema sp.]